MTFLAIYFSMKKSLFKNISDVVFICKPIFLFSAHFRTSGIQTNGETIFLLGCFIFRVVPCKKMPCFQDLAKEAIISVPAYLTFGMVDIINISIVLSKEI